MSASAGNPNRKRGEVFLMKFPGQRRDVRFPCGMMLAGLPLFAGVVAGTWKGNF